MSDPSQAGFIAQETGQLFPELSTQYSDDPTVVMKAEVVHLALVIKGLIYHHQTRFNRDLRGRFVHKHKNTRHRRHAQRSTYRNDGRCVQFLMKKLEILFNG